MNSRTFTRTGLGACALALLAGSPASAQSGRILAAHDVNTLSSEHSGPQELAYAVNLATWLTGSTNGTILAIESSTVFNRNYSPATRAALAQAGFQVTYTSSVAWTLVDFQAYDAVFTGITYPTALFPDPNVLAQYVQGGGSVYIFGGVGNSPSIEASRLNPFLMQFGLMYESFYNGLVTSPICGLHPVMAGVTALGVGSGQPISDLGTTPFARGIETAVGRIVYAIYDEAFVPLATTYCPAVANSTGLAALIDAWGSRTASANSLRLVASMLPANQFGYFLTSRTQGLIAHPGGSQGNLCVVGGIGRFNGQIQNSGAYRLFCIGVNLNALPVNPPVAAQPGESWNFQAWYRDGASSNFTNAAIVTYQ